MVQYLDPNKEQKFQLLITDQISFTEIFASKKSSSV